VDKRGCGSEKESGGVNGENGEQGRGTLRGIGREDQSGKEKTLSKG